MSLFGQTARYLLITALLLALVGSVGFHTLIHRKIRHEVDEILVSQARQAEYRLRQQPPASRTGGDDNPRLEPISRPIPPTFTDLWLTNTPTPGKPTPVRQFQTTIRAHGQLYRVRVQQPYDEFNELARDLSVGVIVGFLVLMALSVLVGLGLSRRLWQPFHTTVQQLGQFRVDQDGPAFPPTHVREFTLLNNSLTRLTQVLRQQFSRQKQFIENASHELQTPLAITTAELDGLLQSPHLTPADHEHLQRATDALGRLGQLNRSLLLLTQVDNDQFRNDEQLDLSDLLARQIQDFDPFLIHKKLTRRVTIQPAIHLWMDRQLAGVLLTNLLKNAVRHCPTGGHVDITLTTTALLIGNTGEPLPFAENLLFGRFVKNPTRPDSIGLGLSLIKQICDRYALPVAYRYEAAAQRHSFQLTLTGA